MKLGVSFARSNTIAGAVLVQPSHSPRSPRHPRKSQCWRGAICGHACKAGKPVEHQRACTPAIRGDAWCWPHMTRWGPGGPAAALARACRLGACMAFGGLQPSRAERPHLKQTSGVLAAPQLMQLVTEGRRAAAVTRRSGSLPQHAPRSALPHIHSSLCGCPPAPHPPHPTPLMLACMALHVHRSKKC